MLSCILINGDGFNPDKMILLTGSSGFLGQTILNYFGDEPIKTLSRQGSDYNLHLESVIPEIKESFKLVIHAAGKAHSVPKTAAQNQAFFDVNVNGTANLLTGLENATLPKSFIYISSVAVYGIETGMFITENAPLLANDPYGKSKIQAEQLVKNWCEKNSVICTILRLPLIAGTTPPGNLKAMINAIKGGYYFNIDGGKAKKSMVLATDVAKIIPVAASIGGIYNLTDRYNPNFTELSHIIALQLKTSAPLNIPLWLATIIAKIGDLLGSKAPINSNKLKKMISDLTFDDSNARQLLGWQPDLVLKEFKINKL